MCVGPMYASKIRILELFQTIIFLLMNELLFKRRKCNPCLRVYARFWQMNLKDRLLCTDALFISKFVPLFMIEGPFLKNLPLITLHLAAKNEKIVWLINMKTFKMWLRFRMHTICVLTYSKCHDLKTKHQSWIVIYSHDRLHYFDIAWHFDAACESQTIFLMYLNLEIHVHFIDFKISSAHVIQLVHILCLV